MPVASLAARRVHDGGDADETDGGADEVEAVGPEAVEKRRPDQRASDEDTAVCGPVRAQGGATSQHRQRRRRVLPMRCQSPPHCHPATTLPWRGALYGRKLLVSWGLHRVCRGLNGGGPCPSPSLQSGDRRGRALVSATLPIAVPGGTAMGKTRMSTAAHEQALRMEAGFSVGSTDTFLDKAMQ